MSIVLKTMQMLKNFRADKAGVTAVEYGMIAALISVVIIGSVTLIGTNLNTAFSTIATGTTKAASSSGGSGT